MNRLRWLIKNSPWIIPWLFKRGREKYLYMQRNSYDYATMEEDPVETVVGSYEAHNNWPDYDKFILKHVPDDAKESWLALDFGCGPGRNIIKYWRRFRRLDGCDISGRVLDLALENMTANGVLAKGRWKPKLYPSRGDNVNTSIQEGTYDYVFSTITLQHICVHEIRYSILQDIHRVLVQGGRFTAQLGYGVPSPRTVDYYANHYGAPATNRACDVAVEGYSQIRCDLEEIGFGNFEYWIRLTGPGDLHPNWIWFTAVKKTPELTPEQRAASSPGQSHGNFGVPTKDPSKAV